MCTRQQNRPDCAYGEVLALLPHECNKCKAKDNVAMRSWNKSCGEATKFRCNHPASSRCTEAQFLLSLLCASILDIVYEDGLGSWCGKQSKNAPHIDRTISDIFRLYIYIYIYYSCFCIYDHIRSHIFTYYIASSGPLHVNNSYYRKQLENQWQGSWRIGVVPPKIQDSSLARRAPLLLLLVCHKAVKEKKKHVVVGSHSASFWLFTKTFFLDRSICFHMFPWYVTNVSSSPLLGLVTKRECHVQNSGCYGVCFKILSNTANPQAKSLCMSSKEIAFIFMYLL